jgi:hypothetical protein
VVRFAFMRRACVVAAVAVWVAGPALARAKTVVQGVAFASVGFTDNVLSLPVPPPGATTPGPDWDFFFQLRPSVVLTTGTPRAIQRLAYVFDANLFASHSEANSYTNRLEWAGFFLPTKATEVLVSAAVSEGRLNTFNLTTGSAQQPLQAVAPGGTTFVGATLLQSLNWELAQNWRSLQTLGFNAYVPIDPRLTPSSFEVDTHWGTDHGWKHDALGFDLRVDWVLYTEVRGPAPPVTGGGVPTGNGVVSPQQQQIINALVLKWKHDFGHFWNTQAELGAVIDTPANGTGSSIVQPAALAAVRYLHPYSQVELNYAHTVQPNTIVGQTFAIDSVLLRVAVPFGEKSRVVGSASGGYQHGSVLDLVTGGTTSSVELILADATITWSPRREFNAYVRYQYFNQIGHASDPAPQPSLSRQTVMLGITGAFPGEPAAVVPTREALRVDRSDATGIPEPHSQPK